MKHKKFQLWFADAMLKVMAGVIFILVGFIMDKDFIPYRDIYIMVLVFLGVIIMCIRVDDK